MLHFVVGLCLLVPGAEAISRLRLGEFPGTFRRFVDEDGQEVHLRGFNAVVKGHPWIPSKSFDPLISLAPEDFAAFRELGMNFIRLGVMWPGVEPAPGVYNATYIAAVRDMVTAAADAGLWTLLDMHQDMGGAKTCGEGIVDWVQNFTGWSGFPVPLHLHPFKTDAAGHVSRKDCDTFKNWPIGQGAVSTQQTFQNLFTDGPHGGLVPWANAWREIAKNTHDLPGVLGFELINEPGVGNPVSDPRRLKSEFAERHNLQPAYDVVATAIREVAPESLVFFQPILISTGCGFTHAPGGAEFANRSVLAFHHYAYPSEKVIVKNKIRDAMLLGTGLFASEFNRPDAQDPEHDKTWTAMSAACDEGAVGFGLWEYKPYCDESTGYGKCITGVGEVDYIGNSSAPNLALRKTLSRPFLPRVGGWLTKLQLKHYTDAGDALIVTADVNMTHGTTEIFLGPYWFGVDTKVSVEVTPSDRATWTLEGHSVLLSPKSSGAARIVVRLG